MQVVLAAPQYPPGPPHFLSDLSLPLSRFLSSLSHESFRRHLCVFSLIGRIPLYTFACGCQPVRNSFTPFVGSANLLRSDSMALSPCSADLLKSESFLSASRAHGIAHRRMYTTPSCLWSFWPSTTPPPPTTFDLVGPTDPLTATDVVNTSKLQVLFCEPTVCAILRFSSQPYLAF